MIVFLGGTCNNSTWRERLIPLLKTDYYNPVVPEWTEEDRQREIWHRENDDLCLYVITPLMRGFYSIAEVVQDSILRPKKTIICMLQSDDGEEFDKVQWKSLCKVQALCEECGAHAETSIEGIAEYINNIATRESHNETV